MEPTINGGMKEVSEGPVIYIDTEDLLGSEPSSKSTRPVTLLEGLVSDISKGPISHTGEESRLVQQEEIPFDKVVTVPDSLDDSESKVDEAALKVLESIEPESVAKKDDAPIEAKEAPPPLPPRPEEEKNTLQRQISEKIKELLDAGVNPDKIIVEGEIAKNDQGHERIETLANPDKSVYGHKIYCSYKIGIKNPDDSITPQSTVNGHFFTNAATVDRAHHIATTAGLNIFASAAKMANGIDNEHVKVFGKNLPQDLDLRARSAALNTFRQILLNSTTFAIDGEKNKQNKLSKLHSFRIIDSSYKKEEIKVVLKTINSAKKYWVKGKAKENVAKLPEMQLQDQKLGLVRYSSDELKRRNEALEIKQQTLSDLNEAREHLGGYIHQLQDEINELESEFQSLKYAHPDPSKLTGLFKERKKIFGVSRTQDSHYLKGLIADSEYIKSSVAHPEKEIKVDKFVSKHAINYLQAPKDFRQYTVALDELSKIKSASPDALKTYFEENKEMVSSWKAEYASDDKPAEAITDEEALDLKIADFTAKREQVKKDYVASKQYLFEVRQIFINGMEHLTEIKTQLENNLTHLGQLKQQFAKEFQDLQEKDPKHPDANPAAYNNQITVIENLEKALATSLKGKTKFLEQTKQKLESVFDQEAIDIFEAASKSDIEQQNIEDPVFAVEEEELRRK